MKVLLFGKMGDIGKVVYDSYCSHGFDTRLVDFPQNVFRDESGYKRELLKAVAQDRPDVIIPVGHQLCMARIRESQSLFPLLSGVSIIAPPSDTVELLDSKVQSSALATELGIRQPKLFRSVDEATSSDELAQARIIFKRDRSFGGCGVYRPKTRTALENLSVHEPGSAFLIEEFIDGCDVSVDCVRSKDAFRARCYVTESKDQGQGPSVHRRIIGDSTECSFVSEIIDSASKILDRCGYIGVCGMDFRVDASGKSYFLECNPRFCGGIETQIQSGFDIPYLLLADNVDFTKLSWLE